MDDDDVVRGRRDFYLTALDHLMGMQADIREIPPRRLGLAAITAAVYVDVPAPGYVTGFTYGLSLADSPDGFSAGREISITVRSTDVRWAMVPAGMVSALWGIGSFEVGRVIGHSRELVEGSSMRSVLLAESPDILNVDLVQIDDNPVAVIGAYPIHASEREFISRNGFEAFWALAWDRYDPLRPPAT